MLFGAILSATDPVSVVDLLKRTKVNIHTYVDIRSYIHIHTYIHTYTCMVGIVQADHHHRRGIVAERLDIPYIHSILESLHTYTYIHTFIYIHIYIMTIRIVSSCIDTNTTICR